MDAGKLKDALPYYEKVTDKLPFEVHTYISITYVPVFRGGGMHVYLFSKNLIS